MAFASALVISYDPSSGGVIETSSLTSVFYASWSSDRSGQQGGVEKDEIRILVAASFGSEDLHYVALKSNVVLAASI